MCVHASVCVCICMCVYEHVYRSACMCVCDLMYVSREHIERSGCFVREGVKDRC